MSSAEFADVLRALARQRAEREYPGRADSVVKSLPEWKGADALVKLALILASVATDLNGAAGAMLAAGLRRSGEEVRGSAAHILAELDGLGLRPLQQDVDRYSVEMRTAASQRPGNA